MGSRPKSTLVQPHEYEILDRYLEAAFQLLEGIASIEEAQETLRNYLELHRQEGLSEELEDLLIRLFFHKCRREFPL